MSDFSDGQNRPVRPLTASTKGEEPYVRPEAVEVQIGRMLCVHKSEWIAFLDGLLSETIIYLIRDVQEGEKQLFGRLICEIGLRIPALAGRWLRDFDPTTTEEILRKVEKQIFDLILAPKATRQTEYLEVAFGQAVKRLTINMVAKYKNNPMVKRGEVLADPADDDNQETVFLEAERKALQPGLLRQAYGAVKDPIDLKIFKLHYLEGIPIQSSDPKQSDLVRRTGETRGRIKYRIERTMKVVRKALGVSE